MEKSDNNDYAKSNEKSLSIELSLWQTLFECLSCWRDRQTFKAVIYLINHKRSVSEPYDYWRGKSVQNHTRTPSDCEDNT